jgi:hypothetical protein
MVSPLVEYMTAKGFGKIGELADHLGLERSYVSRLLSGDRHPGLDVALHIQRKTGGRVKVTAWAARPRRRTRVAS